LDVVAALLLPLAAAAPVTTAIPAAAPPGGGLAMLVITAGEVVAAVVALRGMAPVLVAVPFICFLFLFFSIVFSFGLSPVRFSLCCRVGLTLLQRSLLPIVS